MPTGGWAFSKLPFSPLLSYLGDCEDLNAQTCNYSMQRSGNNNIATFPSVVATKLCYGQIHMTRNLPTNIRQRIIYYSFFKIFCETPFLSIFKACLFAYALSNIRWQILRRPCDKHFVLKRTRGFISYWNNYKSKSQFEIHIRICRDCHIRWTFFFMANFFTRFLISGWALVLGTAGGYCNLTLGKSKKKIAANLFFFLRIVHSPISHDHQRVYFHEAHKCTVIHLHRRPRVN